MDTVADGLVDGSMAFIDHLFSNRKRGVIVLIFCAVSLIIGWFGCLWGITSGMVMTGEDLFALIFTMILCSIFIPVSIREAIIFYFDSKWTKNPTKRR